MVDRYYLEPIACCPNGVLIFLCVKSRKLFFSPLYESSRSICFSVHTKTTMLSFTLFLQDSFPFFLHFFPPTPSPAFLPAHPPPSLPSPLPPGSDVMTSETNTFKENIVDAVCWARPRGGSSLMGEGGGFHFRIFTFLGSKKKKKNAKRKRERNKEGRRED